MGCLQKLITRAGDARSGDRGRGWLSFALVLFAAGTLSAQQSFSLQAPSPQPPATISARASASGLGNYCYWIIATYPVGKSGASQPTCIALAGGTVTITWSVAPGASSYDILRTATPFLPSGTSSIAVATAVSGTSQTDNLGSLSSYTLGPAAPGAVVNFSLINSTYPNPLVWVNQPVLLPPAAFTVATLPSATLFAGYWAVVTDGNSASDCTTGGGTNKVSCYASGGAWASIGGGGGGGGGTTFPLTVSGTVNSGGVPCFTSTTVMASSGLIANGDFLTGGGAGGCVADSGLAIGGLVLINPAGQVNLIAANITTKFQTGSANPGLVLVPHALESTPQTGELGMDLSANHFWYDGSNLRESLCFLSSGFTTPSAPAAGHFVTWGGTNFCQQDGGAPTYSTLTDGATVTWALASQVAASADLTFTVHSGSRTLNITGPLNGGQYTLWLKQDGTGGEGLTLGTGCTWKVSGGGGGAITPSTGANAVDVLTFTYDGTNCYANFQKNFT